MKLLLETHSWMGLSSHHEVGMLELNLGFITLTFVNNTYLVDLISTKALDEDQSKLWKDTFLGDVEELTPKTNKLFLPLNEEGLVNVPKKSKGKKKSKNKKK